MKTGVLSVLFAAYGCVLSAKESAWHMVGAQQTSMKVGPGLADFDLLMALLTGTAADQQTRQ